MQPPPRSGSPDARCQASVANGGAVEGAEGVGEMRLQALQPGADSADVAGGIGHDGGTDGFVKVGNDRAGLAGPSVRRDRRDNPVRSVHKADDAADDAAPGRTVHPCLRLTAR